MKTQTPIYDAGLERQAVNAFAREEIRERLLHFVDRPKRRSDLLKALHTSNFFKPSVLVSLNQTCNVQSRDDGIVAVLAQMHQLGVAKSCCVISVLPTLEGRTFPLAVALDACFFNTVESLLFDPTSNVGYFEGGHANDRFILRAS
jgi:hypothetical protein